MCKFHSALVTQVLCLLMPHSKYQLTRNNRNLVKKQPQTTHQKNNLTKKPTFTAFIEGSKWQQQKKSYSKFSLGKSLRMTLLQELGVTESITLMPQIR